MLKTILSSYRTPSEHTIILLLFWTFAITMIFLILWNLNILLRPGLRDKTTYRYISLAMGIGVGSSMIIMIWLNTLFEINDEDFILIFAMLPPLLIIISLIMLYLYSRKISKANKHSVISPKSVNNEKKIKC